MKAVERFVVDTYATSRAMVTRRVIEVTSKSGCDALMSPIPLPSTVSTTDDLQQQNASITLKSVSQTNGHVFHFLRLQTAIPGSRCVPCQLATEQRSLTTRISTPPALSLVDSEMCETAVSQKVDLLARIESVLVGSVKMSECSSAQLIPPPIFISSAQAARQ
jgi:hypothetical protein